MPNNSTGVLEKLLIKNCRALRKCLLKPNKMVKIGENVHNKLFCVRCGEVSLVSSHVGLAMVKSGQEKQAWPLFHNELLRVKKTTIP